MVSVALGARIKNLHTMGLGKEYFVVNRFLVGGTRLIIVVVQCNRVRGAGLPGREIKHPMCGENGTSSGQLLCTPIGLHNLIDCVMAARTAPGSFDNRDMF